MSEEKKKNAVYVMGAEFTESQLGNLVGMFSDPGYAQYKRLLEEAQKNVVDSSLGTRAPLNYEAFCQAQSLYGNIEDLLALPEEAKKALESLKEERKAQEQTEE